MTGLYGGSVTGRSLERMASTLRHERWYADERFEERSLGAGLVHHGDRDPGGRLVWHGDGSAGVVSGAITNLDELGLSPDDLFEKILKTPTETLQQLEGPFALAAIDGAEDRAVVATDKLGSRACFYRTDGRFLFGSEVKAILALTEEVQLDHRGVNDLLLVGHMWGEHTLVDGIRAIPPATVLEFEEGTRRLDRYWWPSFTEADPGQAYLDGLVDSYQCATDRIAGTLSGDVGVFLSGGLDSRPMAAAYAKNWREGDFGNLVAYSYDANPPGANNPALARRVADELGVSWHPVDLTPDRVVETIERAVDITDGLLRWTTLINLSTVFSLPTEPPEIVIEGAGQGEIVGDYLTRTHLQGYDSPMESMYRSEADLAYGTVRRLVETEIDPMVSFVEAAQESDERTTQGIVKDLHMRHFYSKYHLLSNQLARSQFGTRVPYLDSGFLDHVAQLPLAYRMQTFPMTESIPYGIVQPKLALARGFGPELARIPYERTRLPPSLPMWTHVIGFLGSAALHRVRGRSGYGSATMADIWYRENRSMRTYINGLIDGVVDREIVNGDLLRDIQRDHLAGAENNMDIIAPLTTLELWMRRYYD